MSDRSSETSYAQSDRTPSNSVKIAYPPIGGDRPSICAEYKRSRIASRWRSLRREERKYEKERWRNRKSVADRLQYHG